VKSESSIYFVNGWVDGFFIGFVSIGLFLYLRYFQWEFTYSSFHLSASIAAAWLVNWPHIFATNCRLYQSAENRNQYPFTAYGIPIVMLILAVLAFASPENFAPYLIKILFLWSPYHFSGQTIGISLLYAKRANLDIPRFVRTMIIIFVYSTYLFQTTKIEANAGLVLFSNISYPLLGIPKWVSTVMLVFTYISMFILLGWGFIQRWRRSVKIPWILILPLGVQYLWFVHANDLVSFQLFISSLHGLQYLLIAWAVQVHFLQVGNKIPNPVGTLVQKTALWFGITFIGGASLFFGVPALLSGLGWNLSFSSAVMLAIFQMHHFFVDGVIWKLRMKNVSTPLLIHVPNWIKERKA
jgi:hypothetical protein